MSDEQSTETKLGVFIPPPGKSFAPLFVEATVREIGTRKIVRVHPRIDFNDRKQGEWLRRAFIWAFFNDCTIELARTIDKPNGPA